MNENYLKILDRATFTKSEIERLFQDAQDSKGFENNRAYSIVETLVEQLDTVIYKLKRLSMPAVEGKLQEDTSRNKFELIRSDNGRGLGWFFSCGDYLEVMGDDGEWYSGRVEHTKRDGYTGYYFCNDDIENPFLFTGMVARVRRE